VTGGSPGCGGRSLPIRRVASGPRCCSPGYRRAGGAPLPGAGSPGARARRGWAELAATHLGQRRSPGAANAITLARANLPALAGGRWTGPAVLAVDLLDGQLARRRGEVTVFGSCSDTIADAVFWTWFAARHEPSMMLRTAAAAAGRHRLPRSPR
jgi:hypothetical protein